MIIKWTLLLCNPTHVYSEVRATEFNGTNAQVKIYRIAALVSIMGRGVLLKGVTTMPQNGKWDHS